MNEYHLQMAWKLSVLAGKEIRTIQGDLVEIINPGYGPNEEGGPDFMMAKIKINNTHWVGSIEVHLLSSLWYVHKHDKDSKYNNVILHVVWEHDKEVLGNHGGVLPCVALKQYIPLEWFQHVDQKLLSQQSIPCAPHFHSVPPIIFHAQLDVMLVERLESRLHKIKQLCQNVHLDWDECLYRFLASFMGQKVNNIAMEELVQSVSWRIISKHRNALEDIESLLFGQAGFLEAEDGDEYYQRLKNRHAYFAHKYGLKPVYGLMNQWQYKGVRPAGFPERCIAKLACLLHVHERLLHWAVDEDLLTLMKQTWGTGAYWTNHCRFGKAFKKNFHSESSSLEALCTNVIIPFRIAYKKEVEQLDISTYLDYYEVIRPEKNKVVTSFNQLGFATQSARDTQSLLQLYNNYCNYKKCLSCKAGHFILKKEGLI